MIKTPLERAWTIVWTKVYTEPKGWKDRCMFCFSSLWLLLHWKEGHFFYLGIPLPFVLQTANPVVCAKILPNLIIPPLSCLHWQSIPSILNHPQMHKRNIICYMLKKTCNNHSSHSNYLFACSHTHSTSSLSLHADFTSLLLANIPLFRVTLKPLCQGYQWPPSAPFNFSTSTATTLVYEIPIIQLIRIIGP